MTDVLTIGESMLRMTPAQDRLSRARVWETWVAGCESNFAATLATLGVSVSWVGRLPKNPLGRRIVGELAAIGIDTSKVIWAPETERLGTFYFEPPVPPRPAQTIYDRADSAASRLAPSDIPATWFAEYRHLHVSGITPALSKSCAESVQHAIVEARKAGMSVSFDVNYRGKLWTPKRAEAELKPLMQGLDVLICSSADARTVFQIEGDPEAIARDLQERFDAGIAVLTTGADGAVAYKKGEGACSIPAFPIESTLERLGSGDSFAGGFIAAYLGGEPTQSCLRLGAACAALKRTVRGDMLIASRDEIDAVLKMETAFGWR